jgi:membrane-bound lytic murein transglycosylase D
MTELSTRSRLRRAPIWAVLLLAAWAAAPVGGQSLPGAGNPRTRAPADAADPATDWIPPQQGHQGPELYDLAMPDQPAVAAFVAALRAGNMDWIQGALDRGSLYRGTIVALLERYRLPYELLFLPVVESEYRPWAVSSSGAAGMWQFMANSIAGYNMRVDDMVDERRDFWKASDAALRKLEDNYEHFGDWLLAIAAYNSGRGFMDRVIASSGLKDFWKLRDGGYLPPETARYIPKFLGVVKVASYPGRYGLDLSWDSTVAWDRIPMDKSVNIELLAAVTGAPAAVLERGNAELHYPVTPPAGTGYALKVPLEHRDKIVAAINDPAIALMRYHVYTIRTGDTLYALAGRFGVTVDLITRHNVGVDPQRLRIGAKLFIPLLGDPKQDELVASDRPAAPRPLTAKYTVEKGDTLWSVSRRYGVSVEDLAAGTGIKGDAVIRPSDVLNVPDNSGIMGLDE